ncbi:MAG: KOW domain-containing RNA-binding protein [Oscillospiraceae bacterium]
MEIQRGTAAMSKAGRDKGRYFAVLEISQDFALIADGKLRRIEKPKRKKLKHLSLTTTIFTNDDLSSDNRLRKAINNRFYVENRHEGG